MYSNKMIILTYSNENYFEIIKKARSQHKQKKEQD